MQNFLSQAMEAAEDAGLHPGQGYSNIEHAQYDGSQYGFAQDTNPFPIDQNLDMSVNFASNDAKNQDEGLGSNHMSLPAQNGHGGVMGSHHASTNTSTSLATATQPQTPLNPSTKRKSPEISETTPVGGDSRRKRSKVSRACDQCRKKKVRCDADSGDGNLKTCTNCIKQGQTCDYNRIPQKRGPSKGYIKDLSERVHHLEDSLANASNYRSSLDAGTYVDTAFSPEEDPALRRQTSISQQRSPFADFTRERFPSIGGWNNNNQPSTQTRDRSSIAIPPDQLGPSQPVSAKGSKPWWAPQKLPPEKVKTPAEVEETVKLLEHVKMDHYYEFIHPQCSILPDKTRTFAVLEKTSPEYVVAFSTAIRLLPQKKNNSTSPNQTKEELETFIAEKARVGWAEKTNIDNLVLLWCTLFLHVVCIHDMQAYAKQDVLVNIELHLVSGFAKMKEFMMHDYQHEYEWIQGFSIAALFARLNAVSHGNSNDPLPSQLSSYLDASWHMLTQRTRFTVMMTDAVQAALSTLPKDGTSFTLESSEGFARLQSSNARAVAIASDLHAQEPFVKEITSFVTLLSLRFSPGARPAIVGPVCNLVEAIRVNSLELDEDKYLFNPLSFHTSSLATMALLELQSCNFDEQQGQSIIEAATGDMMKQLAELGARRAQLDGGAGGLFWAKALTSFAEEKMKQSLRAFSNPEDKGEDEIVPEMARILHQGYLYPLLDTISK